ncbi:MAG: hypothetical protein JSU59_03790 [Nitrospirota bacterium]|nr:MAG: hypothetical protein JSU59_03790 [Nitrospirota bacterium]
MITKASMSMLVTLFLAVGFSGGQAQAAEKTVKAMATWQAQGLVTQIDKDQALMVGALMGALFIDGGHGKLDASSLLCPGTIVLNLNTGARSGQGRCVITDKEGDKIYAKWSSRGNEKGMKGPFNFVGGTGKFMGISGDNSWILRIAMRAMAGAVSDDSFQQVAAGLAVWPKLHYKLPSNFR